MRRKATKRIEQLLFAVGFVCMAIFLWTLGERTWYQRLYLDQLNQESDTDRSAREVWPAAVDRPAPLYKATVLKSGPIGRIEIPRAHVSAAILDGVDTGTLDRAVGHVPGTAYPGEATGRIALAAHRDSFFRNLGTLKKGDIIRLEVAHHIREYKVESTDIVKPQQTEVLAATSDSMVTLITCYPFQYVGNAPERFIVQARFVEHAQRAENRRPD